MQTWQQQQESRPWDSSLLFGGIADLASARAMLGLSDSDITGSTPVSQGSQSTGTPLGMPQAQAPLASNASLQSLNDLAPWPQEQQRPQTAYNEALLEALRPSTMAGTLGDHAHSIFDSVSPPAQQVSAIASSLHGPAALSSGNVASLPSARPATAVGAGTGVSAVETSPKPKKKDAVKDSKEKSGKRPRRRYDEIERLYRCNYPGCTKAYGTLNHLNSHKVMQKHGPKATSQQFRELRKIWRQNRKLTGSALLRPTTANGALDLGALESDQNTSPRSSVASPSRNLPSGTPPSAGGPNFGDVSLSHIRPAVTDSVASSSSSPFAHNISLHSRGPSIENISSLTFGDLTSHVMPSRPPAPQDLSLSFLAGNSRPQSSQLPTPDAALNPTVSQTLNGAATFNGLGSSLGSLGGGLTAGGLGTGSLLPSLGSDLGFGSLGSLGGLGAGTNLGSLHVPNFSRPSTSYDTLLNPMFPLSSEQTPQSSDSHKHSSSSYSYNNLVDTCTE